MKFILGKKLAMTQKFKDDGNVVPVTAVLAGPCVVTQVRTDEKDGYKAVQIGFGFKKKLNKPQANHLKDLDNFRYLKEFRLEKAESKSASASASVKTTVDKKATADKEELKRGDKIDVGSFEIGDVVKVSGTSKGKGFQGVVKRHGFHGSPASHGHKDQLRMPGSIGATGPARVFKGTRMPGHMGDKRVTVKNLEIIEIDQDRNILFIKGAIPGARNGLVEIVG